MNPADARAVWVLGTAMGSCAIHLAAVVLVHALPGLPGSLRRRFTLFFLVPAWYCLVSGPSFAGLLVDHPRWMDLSQLVTGYAGVLLFQLTRALLDPERRPKGGEALLYLGGVPATFLSVYLLTSPNPAELIAAYETRDMAGHPFLATLWAIHGSQLILFVLASAVVVVRANLQATDERARSRARWAAGPIVALGLATWVSVILPLTPIGGMAGGLGPLFTTPMALAAVGAAQHAARTQQELRREWAHMRRYLAPQVVERIAAGRQRLELGGEQVVGTVLMADTRGFTRLSTKLVPTELVALLNEHLGTLAREVLDHGGMLDKFIGDAALAVFGVPDGADDAVRAVRCAQAMLVAAERANARRVAAGGIPLHIGVGLARGPLVHGNIGAPERMEYTVIGDTVNVASRVEGLTKELGEPLLVTESVVEACAGAVEFEWVATRVLRGRSEPTRLYRPVGLGEEDTVADLGRVTAPETVGCRQGQGGP
ncbi:MAG: adenylate/guanylate cyclase domain-containing protein [Deltaproteobacteria bacterium]|nr:MAG: adenylate/guanylate cyclase domain-containing protein [Deltaproteobacteria bacterium]